MLWFVWFMWFFYYFVVYFYYIYFYHYSINKSPKNQTNEKFFHSFLIVFIDDHHVPHFILINVHHHQILVCFAICFVCVLDLSTQCLVFGEKTIKNKLSLIYIYTYSWNYYIYIYIYYILNNTFHWFPLFNPNLYFIIIISKRKGLVNNTYNR